MRTYPGVRPGQFRDPGERNQIKVIDDMLRQVTGALTNSIFKGQKPVANTTPPPSTPPAATLVAHDHTTVLTGGQLHEGALSLSNITTNDVTVLRHGFTPIAPNNTALFLRGDASWAALPATTHVVLDSAVHTDTLTGTVVRGDLIVGNSTPKWSRLAKGSSGQFLKSDANDAAWATLVSGDLPSHTHAETDITDGTLLARLAANEVVTGNWTFGNGAANSLTVECLDNPPYAALGLLLKEVSTGFTVQLVPNATDTADGVARLPVTGGGTVVLVGTTESIALSNKRLTTGTVYHVTSSIGRFSHTSVASPTNYVSMDLAAITGQKITSYLNLTGAIPIVGNDPPAVAAGALGKVDLTAQAAGIGSTNLSNTPPAGLYRVDVYVACTTASGSGAPTLDVNIAWTDVVGATNRNVTAEPGATAFPLSLAGTGRASASLLCQVASGNIAYTTTINAASGSPQYAIYIRVTALG